MILPKPYISYSSYSLWKRDKDAFRRKYYEGEKLYENREMIYGKKIAELLELKSKYAEYHIEIDIGSGIKVMGYMDRFYPRRKTFDEFKTGHKDKDGNAPWSASKVKKHEQLVFYSLLIKKKFGTVCNKCRLIWLETEFINKTTKVGNYTLVSDSQVLRLTGNKKIFERIIYEWERKKLVQDIIKIAQEISYDYENYKRVHEQDSKVGTQEVAAQ